MRPAGFESLMLLVAVVAAAPLDVPFLFWFFSRPHRFVALNKVGLFSPSTRSRSAWLLHWMPLSLSSSSCCCRLQCLLGGGSGNLWTVFQGIAFVFIWLAPIGPPVRFERWWTAFYWHTQERGTLRLGKTVHKQETTSQKQKQREKKKEGRCEEEHVSVTSVRCWITAKLPEPPSFEKSQSLLSLSFIHSVTHPASSSPYWALIALLLSLSLFSSLHAPNLHPTLHVECFVHVPH